MIGELVGAALMTRALVTGPIAVIVFAVLLHNRIAVEERALGGFALNHHLIWLSGQ